MPAPGKHKKTNAAPLEYHHIGRRIVPAQRTVTDEEVKRFTPAAHWIARKYQSKLAGLVDHEDLLAECMIAIWDGVASFDPDRGANIMTWVSKKMHQSMCRLLKIWKTSKRAGARDEVSLDKTYGDDGDSDGHGFMVQSELDTEALATQHERAAAVWNALTRLPARERDILLGRFDDDETLKEIGDRHGVCRERIRQLEERALDALGERMREHS